MVPRRKHIPDMIVQLSPPREERENLMTVIIMSVHFDLQVPSFGFYLAGSDDNSYGTTKAQISHRLHQWMVRRQSLYTPQQVCNFSGT